MRNRNHFAVLILSVLSITGCLEEPVPKSQVFPIFTTSVSNVDNSGVTLTIDVRKKGTGSIRSFGFLWAIEEIPNFSNFRASFEEELGNSFSAHITFNLSPEEQYNAVSYVILETDTVFSNIVSFLSLGSSKPTITDFFPTSGIDGDTVTIIGTNFSSLMDQEVSVSFGNLNAPIVSTEVKEIRTIVPKGSVVGKSLISLTVFDNQVTTEGFEVIAPTIESISPESGFDGTEVVLIGNFSKVPIYNEVLFNGSNPEIIEGNDKLLRVISPNTSFKGNTTIKVVVNGKKSNQVNYVIGPVIETVFPLEGEKGKIITIQGLGFPSNKDNNSIKLGSTQVEIVSSSTSKFEFLVPNITSGIKNILLNTGSKTVVYGNQFNVYSDWKDGVSFPSPRNRIIS